MANEIIVRSTDPLDTGGTRWSLLLLFDISAEPIIDNGGAKQVVMSSARINADVAGYVPGAWSTAIDAGDALWMLYTVDQTPGESSTALLARVRAAHPALKLWLRGRHADQLAQTGLKQDASA